MCRAECKMSPFSTSVFISDEFCVIICYHKNWCTLYNKKTVAKILLKTNVEEMIEELDEEGQGEWEAEGGATQV